jgi:Ubiquitin carboxyl-terminal hydrolase
MAMQPSAILDTSLSKRNNVAALLAREIVFREARQPDHKMEALRKKYTPINESQLKAGSIPNNGAEDEESFDHIALVDENGFERAAKQLFDPSRLQLTWKNIQPVGLGIQNLGNTCFLSSTLQALTYVPAFAQYLLSEQHGRSCKSECFDHVETMSQVADPSHQVNFMTFVSYVHLSNTSNKHWKEYLIILLIIPYHPQNSLVKLEVR